MIDTVSWRQVPQMAGNRLFLDYVEGRRSVLGHYSHEPLDYSGALAARRGYPYPRETVSKQIEAYVRPLGASERTLENTEALKDPDVYCVVGGQQAGFLGGPAYVAYKIASTIRLARILSSRLGIRAVPVFWLASEDHDFGEINHTHYLQPDGEIGRISFDWAGKGRPISDLPMTEQVLDAWAAYWSGAQAGPYAESARQMTEPLSGRYCDWIARLWLRTFADEGLIVLEPATLRPAAGGFLRAALRDRAEIGSRLASAAADLERDGYTALLDPQTAGVLYTFSDSGHRVRVEEGGISADQAADHPERFSTDAALRPLLADGTLPVIASTLGAGELAYQGMLRPLYELFGIPQPICFPRQSFTIVSSAQRERLAAYGLGPRDILTSELDIDAVMRALMPAEALERFAAARAGVESALLPLKDHVEGLDPNLGRSWEQALSTAHRNIDKLEERAINVTLSRQGYARRELQSSRNLIVPRGRLQERVLPITHFVQHYGPAFVNRLCHLGDAEIFEHAIITVESGDG
ncbi:MAG: bacillithiol biosynthesis cysteine-adding enzyme BshC [Chloroflexi bacterium]|nr:bacillithiol biosynthesis cysteine-adding enzyme BshC [Chloroflexota bacterium]